MAAKLHSSTPIYRLPSELIAAIFLLCVPHNPGAYTPNPTHPPLLLCHVCQNWRTIARGLPFLWRHLALCSKDAEESHGEAELVDMWSWNATPFPIELKLDLAPHSPPAICSRKGGEEVISSILLPSAHRFVSLDITTPSFVEFPLPVVFSLLEHLSLVIHDNYPAAESLAISTFAMSPKLRSTILSVPADILPTKLRLPYAQITSLTLCDPNPIPPTALHSILSVASSLEHLNATLIYPNAHTAALHTQTISLEHLQELLITFHEKPNPTTSLFQLTFRPLHIPSLSSLSLTCSGPPGSIPFPWQDDSSLFFEDSLRNVTDLTLKHYEFTWGMMRFLECTPAVERLEVVLGDLSGIGLWEALVRPGLNLLPQLAHLEVVLGRAGCATWSIEVLCAMVLSRWTNLQTTELGTNPSLFSLAIKSTHSRLRTVHLRIQPHPLTDSPASWTYSTVALIQARLGKCSVQGMGLELSF